MSSQPIPRVSAQVWRELTDPVRLPLLSKAGRRLLARMYTHPAAPHFRNFSGHRLGWWARWEARWRHAWLRHAPIGAWATGEPVQPPPWVKAWWAWQSFHVPAWPRWQDAFGVWAAQPTTSRHDLQRDLLSHMPRLRQQDARLICFTTSGTTGHPIRVPSLPVVAASYLALHERALALHGVGSEAGAGRVAIVLAGYQRRCFTYVSVNPLRGDCGLAKINLHPEEWRDPADRARYLDALQPELISGDPVSLDELAQLPMTHRPRALLSTSMTLSSGLRSALTERFGCPVLDLYSMNEVGPVGVYVEAVQAFVLLQPGLYVEILNAQGLPQPAGTMGEITVTGGFNPCLPLRRYRTGDHARLIDTSLGPALRDLQGRPPVKFLTQDGRWINNVDISRTLRPLPLRRYALHQHHGGRVTCRVDARALHDADLRDALMAHLRSLLGDWPLALELLTEDDKVRQYTSDLIPPS